MKKKLLILLAASFAFFTAQADLITQEEADGIVLERLSQETRPYTVYAKDGVQQKMTVTTINGEVIEVNYKFWIYYISYTNSAGQYIFVKQSNGNLLEVNVTSDATPEDLAEWRIVKANNCNELKIGEITEFKWEGETACNTQYGLLLNVKGINDSRCPEGVICTWAGNVPVEFHLTTKKGQYNFTLEPSSVGFKSDTVIEDIRYRLVEVSPYPVIGEPQVKTVKILVDSQSNCDQDVIISEAEFRNAPNDYLSIIDMEIVDDCLKIKFSASGCSGNNWDVKLIASEILIKTSTAQWTLRLSLDNKEACLAVFTKEVSFNIKDLQIQGDNKVVLNISGNSILYEYKSEEIAQFSEAEMTKSINHFSMEFFATAHEELNADENIVLSPLSLNMALAMVWNGANGETRQGIQQAMGMQNYSQEEVNNYFLNLRDDLTTVDPDVKLALANSIWYDNGFPVKTDFITVNKDYYDAEVKEIDFRVSDAPDQINQWCSDNTNGLIDNMIDEIPGDVVMYLINALYFKGLWADSCGFDPEHTRQVYFNKEKGGNVLVDMMTQKRKDIDYYNDDHLEMVTLPYGNGAYSMIFALPKGNFGEMLLQLKQSGYWQNCLSNLKPQEVELFIPKFKVEYEPKPNLNNILTKLGMGIAFTDAADFLSISDVSLAISEVRQKTYIEVDEKGTEAAAVTLVGMFVTSVPSHPVFYANRPFLFVIQENTTGTALFMGKIGSPN